MSQSDSIESVVYVDGSGERWKLAGVRIWTTLRSEKTGAVVTCDERTMNDLAMEINGKIVKPLGRPARAGCT